MVLGLDGRVVSDVAGKPEWVDSVSLGTPGPVTGDERASALKEKTLSTLDALIGSSEVTNKVIQVINGYSSLVGSMLTNPEQRAIGSPSAAVEKVTVERRRAGRSTFWTMELDKDRVVVHEYESDPQGNPSKTQRHRRPGVGGLPVPSTAMEEVPGRRRGATPKVLTDTQFRERLFSEEECFFPGCAEFRLERKTRHEAAGGEKCPPCVRTKIDNDILGRAAAVYQALNPNEGRSE